MFRVFRVRGANFEGASPGICTAAGADCEASLLSRTGLHSVACILLLRHLSVFSGSAEALPLEDNSVDVYTISFGIRNVTNIDQALREAHRVLVPGGRFMCLEFSHVTNPLMKQVYDTYSFEVIPVLGEVVAGVSVCMVGKQCCSAPFTASLFTPVCACVVCVSVL